jgi:hypothetical protein
MKELKKLVISNMDTNEKYGLIHPLLQPKTSCLDHANAYSVSKFQTTCGSADILSHIFDVTYFTVTEKMDMVDRVMEEVIFSIALILMKKGSLAGLCLFLWYYS